MGKTDPMDELNNLWEITEGHGPIIATAIHHGHAVCPEVAELLALDDQTRLREEDPFTGVWTGISDNRILVHRSRFEFDLNRPPEKAVYLVPSDAWGLELWKSSLPGHLVEASRTLYRAFYDNVCEGLTALVSRFGRVVVYDLHSYNHRRKGPSEPPDDPGLNPEINLGTGTMDRDYWLPVVDSFLDAMGRAEFSGRRFDIRENVKFKGGYFPLWIHEHYPRTVCCLSIEVKKFFMDEWTGSPYPEAIKAVGDALGQTVPGVLSALGETGNRN